MASRANELMQPFDILSLAANSLCSVPPTAMRVFVFNFPADLYTVPSPSDFKITSDVKRGQNLEAEAEAEAKIIMKKYQIMINNI